MNHHITSDLVIAYSQCQRKAFLLLGGEIKGAQHEYQCILEERAAANRSRYISTLPNGQVDPHFRKNGGVRFSRKDSPSCTISAEDLVATCDALLKPTRESARSHTRLEPCVVVGTHSVTDDQKLRLAFAGYVVGQTTRYRPSIGLIVPLAESPKQIRLEPLCSKVRPIINDLRELITKPASEPPPLCLNKHCQLCQFCDHCTKEAEQNDSLSLLERMTPKLIRKYQKKGIFTITQLSYLYKPRRRRKKKATSLPLSFKVELQALAIRTNKIYLHETPMISKQPIELFLDVEGIPDQGFDYLIGLVIQNGNDVSSHSFWADSVEDEAKIFEACLRKAAEYGNAPIYYYGSYDPRAFQRASKKHGIECGAFISRMVNVNSFVFGKVYFPTRSNRLKNLGTCVGASWSAPDPSGLQSLVWRYRWEETGKKKLKEMLLSYNREDCHAARLLTGELQDFTDAAARRSDVDFADRPKQNSSAIGETLHRTFDGILTSGHAEYQRKRVRLRSGKKPPKTVREYATHRCHPHTINQLNTSRKVGRTIRVPRKRKCPRHPKHDLRSSAEVAEHLLIDLVFTESGCRKTIVKYVGKRAYCPLCEFAYLPPGVKRVRARIYGHGFRSWAIYQRVALRLPYPVISRSIRDQLSEHMHTSTISDFIPQFAREYAKTERLLLKRIIGAPIIHIDETRINIRGVNHYVWVLANGTHVVFQLTETRETAFLRQSLQSYEGVLISDFYPGYDSFPCRQQKCLSHLIRDLNDDLWRNPFNQKYEAFLVSARDLLVPIFEDVERYGLKARFLKKHMKAVDRFYKLNIDGVQHKCEIVQKYQKRFARYRESLFLFLIEDGIPWNNNAAERALRHIAVQRKISGSFSKRGATNYLKLLGIAQTCRFQDKSFLKFLLSGERDVDKYKERRRRKSSK
jgi:predicted RecB family nuclease